MRRKTAIGIAGLLAYVLAAPALVLATSVEQMNLEALTANADKIFRGTVISVQAGMVNAGGAELPTVTYTIKVDESLKGDFALIKENIRLAKITMITDAKPATDGIRKFAIFRDVPRLSVGGEYLLFMSAESSIGLSTTIGLDQGCFDIDGSMAMNRAGNLGLFRGSSIAGPAKGAIAYEELADRVRMILSSQGV